jgi:hypothetical protein
VLPLVGLSTAGLMGAKRSPRVPMCKQAADWVTAHRSELPTTLLDFSRYAYSYRKAIYAAMPGPVRERIWREKLDVYVASHALDSVQRGLIAHIRLNISTYVSDSTGATGRRALKEEKLPERIYAAFGRQEGSHIMNIVGFPGVDGERASTGRGPRVAEKGDAASEDCPCSLSWFEGDPACNESQPFCVDPGDCIYVLQPICGPFHEFNCDGACTG